MEDIKSQIQALIDDGPRVKQMSRQGENDFIAYLAGEEYEKWMAKVKLVANRYLTSHDLYDQIINAYEQRNNSVGSTALDKIISNLKVAIADEFFWKNEALSPTKDISIEEKIIFISHSSKDIEYVTQFVKLLENIGLAGKRNIVCSSLSGYWIPNGENIYDYLKKKLTSNVHVIMILSDNYYESAACLNEMGATWIASTNHTAILAPEFEYSHIRGSIDASRIWFKLNDYERLSEFCDTIQHEFKFKKDAALWERHLTEYKNKIYSLSNANKYLNRKQNIEVEEILKGATCIRCVLRFINKDVATHICKTLDIHVFDKNGTRLHLQLGYDELKVYQIYGGENKRIIIDIEEKKITNIEGFDYNTIIRWTTDSIWTSYVE